MTGDELRHLAGCGSLTELQLFDTQVGDGALGTLSGFPRLEILNLRGTHVTAAAWGSVADWKAPATHILIGKDRDTEPTDRFMAAHPGCRIDMWSGTETGRPFPSGFLLEGDGDGRVRSDIEYVEIQGGFGMGMF